MPPIRERHVAAVFIVFMYAGLGALLVGVLAAALSAGDAWGVVAVVAGGVLGAVFGVRRIRRTPEAERGDGGDVF